MIEIFKGPVLPRCLFIWLARDADWSKASRTWWLSSPASHSPKLITSQLLTLPTHCHWQVSHLSFLGGAFWSGRDIIIWSKMPLVSDECVVLRWMYQFFYPLYSVYRPSISNSRQKCWIYFIFVCWVTLSPFWKQITLHYFIFNRRYNHFNL